MTKMLCVIYTFDKSTLAIPWCVGGVALVAGIVLFRQPVSRRFKAFLFMIAVLALGVFGPTMQGDRIEITSDSFSFRTGAWWSPNEHHFSLRNAVGIEIVGSPDLKGRTKRYMRVTLKDGGYDDVPIGDLFYSHEDDILKAVAEAIKKAG